MKKECISQKGFLGISLLSSDTDADLEIPNSHCCLFHCFHYARDEIP